MGLAPRPAAAEDPRPPKEIAAARPVTLGEVATSLAAQSTQLPNVSDLLRHDAEAELAAIDWTKTKSKHRYTLSALIVRLESTPLGARSLSASCTVSAAVRDERGALLAIVEGARAPRTRPRRVSPPSVTRSRARCGARSSRCPRPSVACSEGRRARSTEHCASSWSPRSYRQRRGTRSRPCPDESRALRGASRGDPSRKSALASIHP